MNKKITVDASGEVIGGGVITASGIIKADGIDIPIENPNEFTNLGSSDTTVNVPVNFGKVVKCDFLNIRESPDLDATILGVIDNSATIEILDDDNEDFYKVIAIYNDGVNRINGYCMKKYVGLV